MPRKSVFPIALMLSALPSPSSASVLDVGPPGSGFPFASIQVAIDAAVPGDIVRVHAGSYAPFVLSKPISVLGDGSSAVLVENVFGVWTGNAWGVSVSGIPAGEHTFVSGMTVNARGYTTVTCPNPNPFACFYLPCVAIHDCAGSVTLHVSLPPRTGPVGMRLCRSQPGESDAPTPIQ